MKKVTEFSLERQLFKKVTKKLSKIKQIEYEQLTQKRIDKIITIEELGELSKLIDSIEKIESDKIQAIFTLSKIRGISPTKLMTQLPQ